MNILLRSLFSVLCHTSKTTYESDSFSSSNFLFLLPPPKSTSHLARWGFSLAFYPNASPRKMNTMFHLSFLNEEAELNSALMDLHFGFFNRLYPRYRCIKVSWQAVSSLQPCHNSTLFPKICIWFQVESSESAVCYILMISLIMIIQTPRRCSRS